MPNAVSGVTQRVDESRWVTLPGNTHPLARPEYDRGAVADSFQLDRMLLILARNAAQEA